MAHLMRPIVKMPPQVTSLREERGLRRARDARPRYQRDDCLRWMERGVLPEARRKRIAQMPYGLERGDRYMDMPWRARN